MRSKIESFPLPEDEGGVFENSTDDMEQLRVEGDVDGDFGALLEKFE